MSDNSEIIRAIRGIANPRFDNSARLIQGTVSSINEDGTINVKPILGLGIADILNVQVSTGNSGDALIKVPTIGSLVNILMSSYIEPFVVQYSDVSKYNLMGDEYRGMVKVIELTEKVNKLEETVNTLSTQLKQLIDGYNLHIHTATGALAPTTPPTVPSTIVPPDQIVFTKIEDIENPDITHGAGVA